MYRIILRQYKGPSARGRGRVYMEEKAKGWTVPREGVFAAESRIHILYILYINCTVAPLIN